MKTYFQFAGTKSESANTETLLKAKRLKTLNVTPSEIFSRTGWFVDADNKWKFEIDDSNASLTYAWKDKLLSGGSTLGDVLLHSSLYDNYPEIKDICIKPLVGDNKFDEDGGSYRGMFNQIENIIYVDPDLDNQGVVSVICHESNHAIQKIEGFGLGGQPTKASKASFVRYLESVIDAEQKNLRIGSGLSESRSAALELGYVKRKLDELHLLRASQKLVDYAHHPKPSSIIKHAKNASGWLETDRFRGDDGFVVREVRDVLALWRDIPKSNAKNARNDAIADFCLACAVKLRESIPLSKRNNILRDVDDTIDNQILRSERKIRSLSVQVLDFNAKKKQIGDIQDTLDRIRTMSGAEIYKMLNGENSSYATEVRLNLSKEDRLQRAPWDDMEIPMHEQLSILNRDKYREIGSSGMTISKSEAQLEKARIEFGGDYFAKILLNPMSDASSVIHEAGHYFLEVYSDLNIRDGVSQELRNDFNDILNWLDVTEIEWYSMSDHEKEDLHERFAGGFEHYVLTGESSLGGMFEKFKSWLKSIYQGLSQNKLASSNGAEGLYSKILSGENLAEGALQKSMFDAISEGMGSDIAIATEDLYKSSIGYFAKASGLPVDELLTKFSLNVESLKVDKPTVVDKTTMANLDQSDYKASLTLQGFDTENIWYHGTSVDFTDFDVEKFGTNEKRGDYVGKSIFFTKSRDTALKYAKQAGGDIVKEVFLRQRSPLVIEDGVGVDKSIYDGINPLDFFDADVIANLGDEAKYYCTFKMDGEQIASYMKSKGFDGLLDHSYGQAAVFCGEDVMPSNVSDLKSEITYKEDRKQTIGYRFDN
ncbi:LPD23 domain-containing protein [Photobacterium kishitanii]|uniref:Uncharacterized protein n=1 Tax=Photobacterium kishitanii TaxID=318456 RepID=A0A2T3KLM1_9GAMM|nr:LPD23 domain-containing protein [Photobacterium kishitanii]PSV00602.1 hypothetical protein C9J27_05555 [Photobacterium kishitanii]